MKTFLWLFFLFSNIVEGAYNPFFGDMKSSQKVVKQSVRSLLPPPRFTPLPILPPPPAVTMEIKSSQPLTPISIRYFGYIESDKGKFALIKSDGNTMVLKESSRVYLNNFSYLVRDISSNAVVMEDGLRQIKTIYFSGETENKK